MENGIFSVSCVNSLSPLYSLSLPLEELFFKSHSPIISKTILHAKWVSEISLYYTKIYINLLNLSQNNQQTVYYPDETSRSSETCSIQIFLISIWAEFHVTSCWLLKFLYLLLYIILLYIVLLLTLLIYTSMVTVSGNLYIYLTMKFNFSHDRLL